jgi:PAS domain S-box-containing protein
MISISRRLLLGLTAAIGMSSALTVALLVAYETRSARTDLAAGLDASVSAFARLMEPALWDMDLERAARLTAAFGRDPRIASLTVRERSTGASRTFERIRTVDTALRVTAVKHGEETIGEVRVAFDRGYYRSQIARQVLNSIVVSLITLVATLTGLRLLLRRQFRRPLDQLSDVVRGYAEGRHPPSATAIPYVEFAEFGRVLDSMSAQIRAQLAALGAANRELAALNRFLVMATADVAPSALAAQAARELRELFHATRVDARLDDEPAADGASAELPGPAPGDAVATVPIALDAQRAGTITLVRDGARPFTAGELNLANAVAGQLGAAIARSRGRAAERLLRTAIEQLPDSVIVTDRDRRIVYVNPGFTAITGYSAAEAMGRDPRELKRATDDDASARALSAAIDAGRPWVGRLTNAKKSGEVFFEQTVVTPVRDDRGEVTNHVALGRDVTADMKRDEQYRHAQRMDAVGQLAGGVAHDFNNMLGAVLMQLELLELEERLTPPVEHALQDMRAALERAADLTRQLLTFSRRQAMRVDTQDLNVLAADMLRILTRVIGERIAVHFAPAPRPVPFEGDAGMIEQVIVNLCVNARDAMPDGGRLDLATRLVTLDARTEHPGSWAMLEVRDSGTGMPPEVQARIFEPFFTTKEVGQGTGLGLATTHGIVTQHGGWIDVESVVGDGTTFRVYLPARQAADDRAAPQGQPRAVARGNATVLVVEDEPLVRQTVAYSLQRLGHRVVEATSGLDALRVWGEHGDAIDLVITDMVMPGGVSGVQLVERMRETRPRLRAIVMSGYSLQLSSEVLAPGIAFLPKPFSVAALSGAIDEALDGRMPRR